MYRLIHTSFWADYDVFHSGKHGSFIASRKGPLELVKHFVGLVKSSQSETNREEEAQRSLFEEMMQISLWGNASDLSLLSSLNPTRSPEPTGQGGARGFKGQCGS